MANIIIFDVPTGAVKEYKRSVNTPDYSSRPDVLVNPDVSLLDSVSRKYIKVSGGVLVEMTTLEKTAVDDAIAQAIVDAENAKQLAFDDGLDGSVVADATMNKVDARIDSISSFAELKAFLKIMVRHIYKNQGSDS